VNARLSRRLAGYQVRISGKDVLLVDMTRDQALNELARVIDLLTKLEKTMDKPLDLIEQWANGK